MSTKKARALVVNDRCRVADGQHAPWRTVQSITPVAPGADSFKIVWKDNAGMKTETDENVPGGEDYEV